MLATTQQPVDEMPLDAIAFCDLLARILYRCLKDQEARMLLFPRDSEHPLTLLPQEESQSSTKKALYLILQTMSYRRQVVLSSSHIVKNKF